jgi:hypothetical protein
MMHGGKSLRGAASPAFRHGRYSKFLNGEFRERAAMFLADPTLLSLAPNIAVVDARMSKVLEGLTVSLEKLELVVKKMRDMDTARAARNEPAAAQALAELLQHLHDGSDAKGQADELLELQEQRRRLVRTEVTRLHAEETAITYDRVMTLMAAILDIMFRHCAKDQRRLIMADVQQLELAPGVNLLPAEERP